MTDGFSEIVVEIGTEACVRCGRDTSDDPTVVSELDPRTMIVQAVLCAACYFPHLPEARAEMEAARRDCLG